MKEKKLILKEKMSQVCSNAIFTGNFNIFYFQRLLPLIGEERSFTGRYFKTIVQIWVPLILFSFFFFRMTKIWRVWHILYSSFNYISDVLSGKFHNKICSAKSFCFVSHYLTVYAFISIESSFSYIYSALSKNNLLFVF